MAFVPLPPEANWTNGGQACDMLLGPCACGATHDVTELRRGREPLTPLDRRTIKEQDDVIERLRGALERIVELGEDESSDTDDLLRAFKIADDALNPRRAATTVEETCPDCRGHGRDHDGTPCDRCNNGVLRRTSARPGGG